MEGNCKNEKQKNRKRTRAKRKNHVEVTNHKQTKKGKVHGREILHPINITLDHETLAIHGMHVPVASDSDGGMSDFDEEYFKYRPNPIPIDQDKVVLVQGDCKELNGNRIDLASTFFTETNEKNSKNKEIAKSAKQKKPTTVFVPSKIKTVNQHSNQVESSSNTVTNHGSKKKKKNKSVLQENSTSALEEIGNDNKLNKNCIPDSNQIGNANNTQANAKESKKKVTGQNNSLKKMKKKPKDCLGNFNTLSKTVEKSNECSHASRETFGSNCLEIINQLKKDNLLKQSLPSTLVKNATDAEKLTNAILNNNIATSCDLLMYTNTNQSEFSQFEKSQYNCETIPIASTTEKGQICTIENSSQLIEETPKLYSKILAQDSMIATRSNRTNCTISSEEIEQNSTRKSKNIKRKTRKKKNKINENQRKVDDSLSLYKESNEIKKLSQTPTECEVGPSKVIQIQPNKHHTVNTICSNGNRSAASTPSITESDHQSVTCLIPEETNCWNRFTRMFGCFSKL